MGSQPTQRAVRARHQSQSFQNSPRNSRPIAHLSESQRWGQSFPTQPATRLIPTVFYAGPFSQRLRSAKSVASQNPSTGEQYTNTNATRYCRRGADGMLSAAASRPSFNRLGVDDLVIQRILRHSNVAVTQACYIKTVSEDAKAAMQKLETALNDTYVTPRLPSPGTKGI